MCRSKVFSSLLIVFVLGLLICLVLHRLGRSGGRLLLENLEAYALESLEQMQAAGGGGGARSELNRFYHSFQEVKHKTGAKKSTKYTHRVYFVALQVNNVEL